MFEPIGGKHALKIIHKNINVFKSLMGKKCQNQITKNYKFFQSTNNFDRIIILGHSIGNVDLEYFKIILILKIIYI